MKNYLNQLEKKYQIFENEDGFQLKIRWSTEDGLAGLIVGLLLTIFVSGILFSHWLPYLNGTETDIVPPIIATICFLPLILIFSIHIVRGLSNVFNHTSILFNDNLIFISEGPFSFYRPRKIKVDDFYSLTQKEQSFSGLFARLNGYFNFRYSNEYHKIYILTNKGEEIYLFKDAAFGDPVNKKSIQLLNEKLELHFNEKIVKHT